MKKRYYEIDFCRGLGIILVVLGHALKQTGTLTAGMDVTLSVIYSFHMPLFFLLSGFTALKILGLKDWKEKKEYLLGRACRLLVPYFVIGILYIPVKIYMSKYAIKPYELSQCWRLLIGENPNTALWFLYILFLCSLVCMLFLNMKNLNMVLAAAFVLSGAACALGWEWRFPRYFFFFVLGIVLRSHYSQWKMKICRFEVFLAGLVMFGVSNYFYYRYDGLYFLVTAISGSLIVLIFSCAAVGGIASPVREGTKEAGNESEPLWRRALLAAGRSSMEIYIFSEPVMTVVRLLVWNILGWGVAACTFLCFACALLLPVPACNLFVRNIALLRFLFLGER